MDINTSDIIYNNICVEGKVVIIVGIQQKKPHQWNN